MSNQNLTYGVTGQTLVLDAPEGRPTSVTSVSVYPWDVGDDATALSATTGSASIESVNTTVDVASGASTSTPRKVSLAATTNIAVGREYLLSNAAGESELVEVTSITSGDSVQVRMPLLHDYAITTSTFVSTRMSIAVDSTWIATSTNITDDGEPNPGYRVRWVYVVGGVTYVRYTYADVVRVAVQHRVTGADMDALVGSWSGLLPKHHRADSGRVLLDEAYRRVRDDLFAHGLEDESLRNGDAIDSLVKYAARMLLYEQRLWAGGGNLEELAYFRNEYTGLVNRLFRLDSKIAASTDASSAASVTEHSGVWQR